LQFLVVYAISGYSITLFRWKESLLKNLWFKGSTFRVQKLRRLDFRLEKFGIHNNSETVNAR
jgi:hypothetical protein